MVQHLFGKLLAAVDPVHDLRFACRVRPNGLLEPMDEVGGLGLIPNGEQGIQDQRRVAQPGVAVVPVPRATHLFRQRGGRRRDDCASRLVSQQLQDQRATQHIVPIRAAVGASVRPGLPVAEGVRELLLATATASAPPRRDPGRRHGSAQSNAARRRAVEVDRPPRRVRPQHSRARDRRVSGSGRRCGRSRHLPARHSTSVCARA